jgi:N-acetylglucosaminyldiphosphoundecaprenol N-acetyl-beta-D-mannosaminyltransferase
MNSRVNVLGVGISSINMRDSLTTIDNWVAQRECSYITITGVHGVMESQKDEDLRQIHNRAGMVTPDGMPMVWLGRLAGHRNMTRVCGPDMMLEVFRESVSKGYRHFFYGGNDGVPELLKQRLEERFLGVNIVGTYSPPFRPLTQEEDQNIVNMINETQPDIVWVGLSTPKQERWMAAHVGRLTAPVMIGVGAAFDFNAGLKKRAPIWMQKYGLEWFSRLLDEPKRLWKRYLINNPLFIFGVLRQTLGLKRYTDDWLQEKNNEDRTSKLINQN